MFLENASSLLDIMLIGNLNKLSTFQEQGLACYAVGLAYSPLSSILQLASD